jgi:phosphoserine phosphatase RsbU/P
LDPGSRQLVPKATFNLSEAYVNKGPILVERSEVFQRALAGEIVQVRDLTRDPRVLCPRFAEQEGLASMMVAGMIYQGRRIGVIQLFTEQPRRFDQADTDLLRAVAQLLGAAIEHARLDAEQRESIGVQRQVRMAAKVQSRMLPHDVPRVEPFDVAARYVPSFELGGDFYDFIELEGNLGIAVGDVVGKGIAASLLMASVRASLRAYAQDVYDLDEIISRVNVALSRDTMDNEFATLFYGVLDAQTRRLTYCNAGHEPSLLLRKGTFIPLDIGGMIVGVDGGQHYDKGLIDLEAGDLLVMYTDGLVDAMNFKGERFGRARIRDAILAAAHAGAHDVLNHLLWEMRRFVGLNSSTDDTTIVVVRVGG